MAHVKGSGSVKQQSQKQRHGKRLGLKKFGGETIQVGQIILRQRGARYKIGKGVGMGRDHTIFAMIDGTVQFGKRFGRSVVNVVTQ